LAMKSSLLKKLVLAIKNNCHKIYSRWNGENITITSTAIKNHLKTY